MSCYTLLKAYLAKKLKIYSIVLYTEKLEKLKSRSKYRKAITIEVIMLIYKLRATTVRSDNGFYMLRAITNRSDNVSPQC